MVMVKAPAGQQSLYTLQRAITIPARAGQERIITIASNLNIYRGQPRPVLDLHCYYPKIILSYTNFNSYVQLQITINNFLLYISHPYSFPLLQGKKEIKEKQLNQRICKTKRNMALYLYVMKMCRSQLGMGAYDQCECVLSCPVVSNCL